MRIAQKKLLASMAITAISITTANALSIANCNKDVTITRQIPNGTMTIINYAYVSPNCKDGCPCSLLATSYSCRCNSGYYSTGGNESECSCLKCPVANSTCYNANSFSCNAGYYKNGNACTLCPDGGTSASGATSITSCYIRSGTTGSDSTGTYTYTSNCYYSN